MGRILEGLIFCIVVNSLCVVQSSSPVVLWTLKRIGEGNVESNLNEFSSQQFADLLAWKTEQGNIPIMAFGLDSFSLEDLSSQGGIGAAEPFKKLRRITDTSAETLLFPAVQSAADTISILQSKGYQVYQINAGDALPKLESPNSILIINDKPTISMDDEILRVFSKYTLDFPNVVGMLWGKRSTWSEEPDDEVNDILSRKKRQATTPSPPKQLIEFNNNDGLFLVFRSVKLTMYHKNEQHNATYSTATFNSTPGTGENVTLAIIFPAQAKAVSTTTFDIKMILQKGKMGYWTLTSGTVTLSGRVTQSFDFKDVVLKTAYDLTVPLTDSFHCSLFALFPIKPMEELGQNHTFKIEFDGFQIQAFMGDHKSEFADAYDCVGFFTIGIWSGIFVTIILIAILTWGIKMVMDVKTMDRFDDPKGKPISFGGND